VKYSLANIQLFKNNNWNRLSFLSGISVCSCLLDFNVIVADFPHKIKEKEMVSVILQQIKK